MRGLERIGVRDYMVWRNRLAQMSGCGAPMAYVTECCECVNHRCLRSLRIIDGCVEDAPLLVSMLLLTSKRNVYLGDVERLDAEWTSYALYQLEMAGEL